MSPEPISRRRVIAGLTGGLLAGGVLGALADSPPPLEATSGAAVDDTGGATPVDETALPYARYQYEPVDRGRQFEPTSPINLVAPLDTATFDDLIDIFRAANWYSRPSEYARYAYDREADSWTRSHWSGAETVSGLVGRLHVRCWHLAGTASIQAHVDTPATPKHAIETYAGGATAVAQLAADAGWAVDPANPEWFDLENAQGPDHDGRAIVLQYDD